MRVLVVEDELRMAENIARALREGPGYAVDVTHNGEDALLMCASQSYDVVLLDLMIPQVSGEEVVSSLRAQRKETPVLVLTAADETKTTIRLLNLGADDYMTKPFDLGELIARVRALIRRGKGTAQPVLNFGVLRMNIAEQHLTSGGETVELSPTEFRILEYLMHRPRVIVSKRELLEHLYDFTWEHHSNVIEAHISNLRRKLGVKTKETTLETLRGRGYRLATADGQLV